jgi:chemotaxis methyl-accepting protein methylase
MIRIYLALSRRIWFRLSDSLRGGFLGRAYGRHLHALVCMHSERKQNHSTWFLRNRSELTLMCRLLGEKEPGSSLSICVLACSKGAEVYSILWAIRSARPDLKVTTLAIDISQDIVDFAKEGVYSRRDPVLLSEAHPGDVTGAEKLVRDTYRDQGPRQDVSIFERMTESEQRAMFEPDGEVARVRPWLKDGITWLVGDAGDPELVRRLGSQDIVVANRFLCHMEPQAAEKCLRNIARLVRPGGHLFVSGVDLDVRTNAAKCLGWRPVTDLMRDIHEGDGSLTGGWPFGWYGLEPFCDDLPDWKIRYASVFQVGETS